MRLMLLDFNKIQDLILPPDIVGSYWITNSAKNNLINVQSIDEKWVLKSNSEVKIISNKNIVDSIILNEYSFYTLESIVDKRRYILYCAPFYDQTYQKYSINNNISEIYIGNDNQNSSLSKVNKNNISYDSPNISKNQLKISLVNKQWVVTNLDEKIPLYVDGNLIKQTTLWGGEILFLMGLKLSIVNNMLLINNPHNKVRIEDCFILQNRLPFNYDENNKTNDNYVEVYDKDDYFLRQPRFKTKIEEENFVIDAPPAQEKQDDIPIIYTIGPMLTMSLTSLVTGTTAVIKLGTGEYDFWDALPSITVAFVMIVGVLLFPLLSKQYRKKQKIKKEKLRQQKYSAYVERKRKDLQLIIKNQKQILIENSVSLEQCAIIILNKQRTLWERKIEHDDFLTLRLGIGSVTPSITIQYPKESFSLDEDNLKQLVSDVVKEAKDIDEVPKNFSLVEKNKCAIIGDKKLVNNFMMGLILQMITFHTYEDLKLVIFTDDSNKSNWDGVKLLPYCFDNEKKDRYFATNLDEANQVANYLMDIYYSRIASLKNENGNTDYKSFKPYFVIFIDNYEMVRNVNLINLLLAINANLGFSIIINATKLSDLPDKCSTFISIDNKGESGIFENELISTKQTSFQADFLKFDLSKCFYQLCNIPIRIEDGKFKLPDSYGFLEMYGVSSIDQLNILNRWKNNDPTTSLQAPIGIDQSGEIFKLDVHEKFHGPHGIIAGMTGSGKSELLVSYILSMALNYHPNEVNFVLIDYKGGGLAGIFENRELGISLPHLAGTITNLDTNEINRSLASVQSELKRRQMLFNKARDILSESTIDIYKYQQLYRQGLVKEPIPHLLIISDEFAELKMQQPEFMQQLISTARLGRSLGIHLILATQKPSGIVDDQIWSNSKFRICLKVQEKADSQDVIKRPDAAFLKNVGRFYFQVGYNEYFALGQSAYSGVPYYETDIRKKKVDTSITFINNFGYPIKILDRAVKLDSASYNGEELPNILNYIINTAKEEKINTHKLWLDRIPEVIFVSNLIKKYNYRAKKFVLNPIIGEYDAPNVQTQNVLTIPLSHDGNTIIYGMSGSGKEYLLTTLLYSLITNHTVEELNIYIMDFGAETLKNFSSAPHVGDVVLVNDDEKIINLFKFLQRQLDNRKKIFREYSGDYTSYYQSNSDKSLPNIVVILNNFEAYFELYQDYDDSLISILRDCQKYGIIFVATVNNQSNIKYKIAQYFKQELVLQLNNEYDYSAILGNTNGVFPSKMFGRGLVKFNEVYEFQTASIIETNRLPEFVRMTCKRLRDNTKIIAPSIPILPPVVTLDITKKYLKGLKSIPIGIEKNTLEMKTFNFKRKCGNIIVSQSITNMTSFMNAICKQILTINNIDTLILDGENLLTNITINNYHNTNFNDVISKIVEKINGFYDEYQNNNYNMNAISLKEDLVIMLIGFDKIKSMLTKETITAFDNMVDKARLLGKVSFIFADSVENVRKLESNVWYRSIVSSIQGIFIGNGLTEQNVIRLTTMPRELYEKIPDDYGYSIVDGIASLIKLVYVSENDEKENNDDQEEEII